jgi:hypothetical protein
MGKTKEFVGWFISQEMASAMKQALKELSCTTKTEFLCASLHNFLKKLGYIKGMRGNV